MAEISEDGQILVENHYVGRLDGFRFTPDASSDGIHGKAARHAATQVLATELAARAETLAAAADEAITLTPSGRIVWQASEIGKLERGETALKPRIQLFADEHLSPPDRERVTARLDAWLDSHLDAKLKPLIALSQAQDLTGLARGLAFRLTENLGVLRRDTAATEIKALDQADRSQLRKYGIRFGAFNLYFPALLKPAAAELLLLLWALHAGEEHGLETDSLPERPKQGLTSVAVDKAMPEPYWRAAGFHVAGNRAVRIDMLERLSDLIRARIVWRPAEVPDAKATLEADSSKPQETKPEAGGDSKANGTTNPQAAQPSGATGDGGFRVVPELMSMVGCSGEEFASILRALGFRLERRKIEAVNGDATAASVAAPPAETEATETAAATDPDPASEPVFDEIWRPGKRRDAHRPQRNRGRGQGQGQGQGQGRKPAEAEGKRPPRHGKSNKKGSGHGRGHGKAQDRKDQARTSQPKRERMLPEHSPFAALKELRDSLAARGRPERN